MTSLPLVDADCRDFAASFPVFDPERVTIAQLRQAVRAALPTDGVRGEERFAPGPQGSPDVRVLLYRPERVKPAAPALLYLHGGGFIAGGPEIADVDNFRLARDAGAVIVAVNYRLAPETPFPGPLEDCYAALQWLFVEAERLGVDPNRIGVMGHSAGGCLAAALALLARDRGAHRLKCQFLIYPALDPRTGTPDAPVDNPTTGEFLWTRSANQFGWAAMSGGLSPGELTGESLGHFAPALAEAVAGLPPLFIAVGSLDLFLEEDVAYALRLARAGVPVEAHVYPGGVHRFDEVAGRLADTFNRDLRSALDRLL